MNLHFYWSESEWNWNKLGVKLQRVCTNFIEWVYVSYLYIIIDSRCITKTYMYGFQAKFCLLLIEFIKARFLKKHITHILCHIRNKKDMEKLHNGYIFRCSHNYPIKMFLFVSISLQVQRKKNITQEWRSSQYDSMQRKLLNESQVFYAWNFFAFFFRKISSLFSYNRITTREKVLLYFFFSLPFSTRKFPETNIAKNVYLCIIYLYLYIFVYLFTYLLTKGRASKGSTYRRRRSLFEYIFFLITVFSRRHDF